MIEELIEQTLARIAELHRLPASTYRLQFHGKFTFRDAIAVLPYLRELGITHVYASPYLKAVPGSTHGYDVTDHCRLNDEIGSEKDFSDFVAALRQHDLQQILDTVPNHVGIATNENSWWNDVLANGPAAHYANYFDISWRGSPRRQLHDKVLMPVLGQPYAEVLEKGELTLVRDGDRLWVQYYDRRFPVSRESAETVKDVDTYAGVPGDPASWDRLDALLSRQHYRLAWWESAPDEINYRRFFNVNSLAGLQMERAEVFEETHRLTLDFLAGGQVAGLRIDHPDGLADPRQYFERLQQSYLLAVARTKFDAWPAKPNQSWEALRPQLLDRLSAVEDRPLFVVVEKILAMDEPLPADWAVSGTTGYDFLALTNALFVDPAAEQTFTGLFRAVTGCDTSFEDLIYQKKRLILDIALASELRMLAMQLAELAQKDRRSIDFTVRALHTALRETIACFDIYRTYIRPGHFSSSDSSAVERAVAAAIARNSQKPTAGFHYLRDMLLLRYPRASREEDRAEQCAFVSKFQQLTSPTTAKGIEDTSFYIYNRLTSLNEVGGNPGQFSVSPDALHDYYQSRQQSWPMGLSPLTTHDTKRSEDVRARINALSEIPDDWRAAVEKWFAINAPLRGRVDDKPAPAPNDEYLLYQTLVGAWPLGEPTPGEYADFAARIAAYMLKAMREAKVHTSWTRPKSDYETATDRFLHAVIDRKSNVGFFAHFLPLVRRISELGIINSLSQTLLRLTAPGIPDTYQGSELWDLSLVDPDNRRPVDYSKRQSLLAHLKTRWSSPDRPGFLHDLWADRHIGGIKQLLVWRLLEECRSHRELFAEGQYLPFRAAGPGADNVFSFLRRRNADTLLVIAPRLTARLGSFPWTAEALARVGLPERPGPPLRHLITGEHYAPATALTGFPVGIFGSW